ncbi:efflux RND transporter periplasmic adaptor subunit [Hydrogenophaga electricum]|uniref:NolF secretion protein n=1 Tax=Hydrogenophaga electricum TaxID=1230953 RepID=A0ABQ6C933_9BURK|nr:efflux RND transporter periplasmic adaptor subunit [Hydrogenophaga electricum]GLS16339.1 nolF secretion protein [Hydrogenophaga electricum]
MTHPPSRYPRWFKWALLALLVAAIAVGVARALQKRATQRESAQAAAATLQQPPTYELAAGDTVAVQTLDLVQAVNVSGALKAVQTAAIKARVAGEVQGLTKREGEAVRAGEVLARIDSTEAQARVRQALEQARSAEAQVAIARRNLDNNQALVKQGFISATALDTTTANLNAAEASHRAALAALDIARKGLDDTSLRSPLTGQIAARLVQNGERVGVDARVLEVVDLSAFEVEAALTPADAAAVQAGQPARLTVEGLAQPVPATVTRINPSVQAGSRSVLVYLHVPAVAGMRQGLFVQGQIETLKLRAAALPLSTVRNDQPTPYVQALRQASEKQQVVHVPVRLERQASLDGEPMLVVQDQPGLQVGDQVLRAGVGAIRNGVTVRLGTPR